MLQTEITRSIIYQAITITINAFGAITLNQQFSSVDAAKSFIDRNFYQ